MRQKRLPKNMADNKFYDFKQDQIMKGEKTLKI